MTTYIVLHRSERAAVGTVLYELAGTWAASSPEVAIRRIADGREGEYIAVPQRNWTRVVGENEEVKPRFRFTELDAVPDDAGLQLRMGAEHEDEIEAEDDPAADDDAPVAA